MPYYKTRVAINNLAEGDALQNEFDVIAVTQDGSGTCFLYIRDTTINLSQEPIYLYVDESKLNLYRPLMQKYGAEEIQKQLSGRFALLSGAQGILEEHGFRTVESSD